LVLDQVLLHLLYLCVLEVQLRVSAH